MADSDEFGKVWQERQDKKSIKYNVSSIKRGSKGNADSRQSTAIRNPIQEGKRLEEDTYEEIKPEELIKEKKRLKTQKTAQRVLKHSGTFIFIVSLASTIIILFPFLGIGTKRPVVQSDKGPTVKVQSEDIEAKVIKEATALGLDARYSIYVPKINAKSKVFENVDLEKESEYLKALQKGVAHGKGTFFPGQVGNIFLFSHSVSAPEYIKTYNAVFYDIRNLEAGDEIIIYFSGVKYVYKVSEKIITSPKDVSFLTKDYGGETLILQTCDPPGTTLRRLLVIAKPSL